MVDHHQPVLLRQAITALVPSSTATLDDPAISGASFLDVTFGRGGHTRGLLDVLPASSRVIACDRDAQAVAAGAELMHEDDRLLVVHGVFADFLAAFNEHFPHALPVQGILMDLGLSSPQLDAAERGFSFRADAALDMRMDTGQAVTAASWLNTAEESEIAQVLKEFGEERFARRIAAAIVKNRPIDTTLALADLVSEQIPRRLNRGDGGKHPATRVFQAVRIRVNDELGQLQQGLEHAFDLLSVGGRLVVISFHSLEDRLVKRFFKAKSQGPVLPRRLPIQAAAVAKPEGRTIGKPIMPTDAEIRTNPRARSAVMRVLERAA